MAGAGTKWLIGCGIGCGAIVLVLAGLGVFGALFVRDTLEGFDHAVQAHEELDQRFGGVDQFTPWPDGAIPATRVEAFLDVRASTAEARRQLAVKLSAIPLSESEARDLEAKPAGEKALSIFKIIRSAFGLGAELGGFFDARNAALLEQGMGMGEYTYLYALLYYAFLGGSPDDGPASDRDEEDRVEVSFSSVTSSRRVHDSLLSMLRNQLQGLPPDAAASQRQALAREIEALERDRRRYPWTDGLPPATAASLEPFRERLLATYDPVSNPFELAITTRKGFSVTAE